MPERLKEINAEGYRAEMDRLLTKWGLAPENLQFVDDFPNDINPHRVSKCFKIERKIYFKRLITGPDRKTMISTLRQFEEKEVSLLKDDWTFVKHTLLHEVCHILNRYKDDYECNKWALYEMKR